MSGRGTTTTSSYEPNQAYLLPTIVVSLLPVILPAPLAAPPCRLPPQNNRVRNRWWNCCRRPPHHALPIVEVDRPGVVNKVDGREHDRRDRRERHGDDDLR